MVQEPYWPAESWTLGSVGDMAIKILPYLSQTDGDTKTQKKRGTCLRVTCRSGLVHLLQGLRADLCVSGGLSAGPDHCAHCLWVMASTFLWPDLLSPKS
jgi:hypothetical protein